MHAPPKPRARLHSPARPCPALHALSSPARTCTVLLERAGKLPGQLIGKSPWLQSVHLIGNQAIGDLVEVTLAAAGPNSLTGIERIAEAA